MFRQHHYLNGKLGAGLRCYTAVYQNKPVAFAVVVCTKMKTKYYRVSRLVVLPDYQGIGLGKQFLSFIAKLYTFQTKLPFYLVTSNPQLIRGSQTNWIIKRIGHGSHGNQDTRINQELTKSNSRKRITVTLQYKGQGVKQ